MPRFFFHRVDGGFDRDDEGTDCADLHQARVEALLYAAGTIHDCPDYVWEDGEMKIEVTDEGGVLVAAVVVKLINAMSAKDIRQRLNE